MRTYAVVVASLGATLIFGACKGKQDEAPKPTVKETAPAEPVAKPVETTAPVEVDAAAAAAAPDAGEVASADTAPAEPVVPVNPVIAELAPLWAEIEKCEDLSDLYAQEKCPANFKLLELAKAALAEAETAPTRLEQLHEALVEHIINGTDLKSRNCAAYADWSKAGAGGKKYEEDATQDLALLEALKKLDSEDGYVGYGIANIVSRGWRKDGELRTQLTAALQDKAIKSSGGRRELIRHAGWVAGEVPAIAAALTAIATDVADEVPVRTEALAALSGLLASKPELLDTVIALSNEANEEIQRATVSALGSVQPGTPEAVRAQARMIEFLNVTPPTSPGQTVPSALPRITDLDGVAAFQAWYVANAKNAGAQSAMTNFIYYLATGGRFKDDAKADGVLRKAVDKLLKDKALTPFDKRYVMDTLAALGGPKSVASCKKFVKDADAAVAEAAAKCVEKAQAPK